MTSRLIGHFVHTVEDATRAQHGNGALTRYAATLEVPVAVRAEASVLKGVAAHFVMMSMERKDVMERQLEITMALFHGFCDYPDRLDPIHGVVYDEALAVGDETAGVRAVIDQVASLSDTRAHALFALWV